MLAYYRKDLNKDMEFGNKPYVSDLQNMMENMTKLGKMDKSQELVLDKEEKKDYK